MTEQKTNSRGTGGLCLCESKVYEFVGGLTSVESGAAVDDVKTETSKDLRRSHERYLFSASVPAGEQTPS